MSGAEREARCACGAVRATAHGAPRSVGLCHCDECRRRTGSAFGMAAFFAEADVAICGETRQFTRTADSGFEVRHHFCPVFGSTLFWFPARLPGTVAIAAGAFAPGEVPQPTRIAYPERAAKWVNVQEG